MVVIASLDMSSDKHFHAHVNVCVYQHMEQYAYGRIISLDMFHDKTFHAHVHVCVCVYVYQHMEQYAYGRIISLDVFHDKTFHAHVHVCVCMCVSIYGVIRAWLYSRPSICFVTSCFTQSVVCMCV